MQTFPIKNIQCILSAHQYILNFQKKKKEKKGQTVIRSVIWIFHRGRSATYHREFSEAEQQLITENFQRPNSNLSQRIFTSLFTLTAPLIC